MPTNFISLFLDDSVKMLPIAQLAINDRENPRSELSSFSHSIGGYHGEHIQLKLYLNTQLRL